MMQAPIVTPRDPNPWLDGMSILIEKDKETAEFVDYFFSCDVYAADSRYRKRNMRIGQRRGLFRVDKASLGVELLYAMELDSHEKCFQRAAGKIVRLYTDEKTFPARAHFASG